MEDSIKEKKKEPCEKIGIVSILMSKWISGKKHFLYMNNLVIGLGFQSEAVIVVRGTGVG